MNHHAWKAQHGKPIDGRCFFRGEDDDEFPWGQAAGINAGVMLWQPHWRTYQRMLFDVTCEEHPAHVPGNGPEQDYLSRFWADAPWTHIEVGYNFQMHQLFYAISPLFEGAPERIRYLQNGTSGLDTSVKL